jgi:hypothetical protein
MVSRVLAFPTACDLKILSWPQCAGHFLCILRFLDGRTFPREQTLGSQPFLSCTCVGNFAVEKRPIFLAMHVPRSRSPDFTLVTEVEPHGLGTQRRFFSAFEDT